MKIVTDEFATKLSSLPTGSWSRCEFVTCPQIPAGLIAQLVEHYTGIAEVICSNPVQA